MSALQGGEANGDKLQIIYDVLTGDTTYDTPVLPNNAARETGGNLATVATKMSDGTQQSKLTDGTNISNVLKSDGTAAGQNAQMVAGTYLPVPFTTTSVAAVASTDAGNYGAVAVQITGQGTSSTVTFQTSNDNSTWVSCSLQAVATGQEASSSTTTGMWAGRLTGRYFRLNVTGISAGTTLGTVIFHTSPVQPASTSIGSNTAVGSAVPANAHFIGMQGSSGNLQSVRSAGNLGQTGVGVDFAAGVTPYLYNGTNMDQQRSAAGVTGSASVAGPTASGSSLAAAPVTAGGLAKTANPTAVTDGQVVNSLHDKLGKQVVVNSLRDLKSEAAITLTSSTAETTLIAAQGAGVFADVYLLTIANISATACEVTIRDVTGGGTAQSIYVPAGETRGFAVTESAARKQGTANSAWTATCGTSVASIKVYAAFVKNI